MNSTFQKILGLVSLLVSTASSFASVIAYEPFNYSLLATGTNATGTGFTGSWTGSGSIVAGQTYTGLPVTNSALSSASGTRQFVSFANSLSNGTKYVSFLFKKTATGDPGATINGVYFPNGGTGLFFGFGFGAASSTQGRLGVGTIVTTGTASLNTATVKTTSPSLQTYGTLYFVVLKIDFNTSGANDTVTVYINPTANSSVPVVSADQTALNTLDVGTITGIGLNSAATSLTIDEIRVGDTYGDVAGFAPLPSVPTGLSATPGVNSVSLNWSAASGATGYKVLRGTSTGVYSVTNTAASNSYNDATAVGGTTYFYVVQATNSSGASANSSQVSATPTIALPSAPTGLAATGTNAAVLLSWNTAAGAASYNVKRSTTSGAESTITNVATTSYTDASVVNGTAYFYKVSSTNAAGESANSSEVTATPNVPPAAPTGLTATAGTNQVALAWTGSAGAASYNVKRSTTSGSGYSTIGTTTAPTVAYTDTTATKFTQYFYVVSAVSAYGESGNSTPEADATPTGVYAPSAYEPFNYALGAFTNNTPTTALGFTNNWSVADSPTFTTNLTYPNLATAGSAYKHAATANRTTVNFTSPMSNGTRYVSFLFKGSGNSGGDTVGVFLKGNNANSLFAGFRSPFSASQTGFGLGTVSSTTLGGATGLGSTLNVNNTDTNLIVLKIAFNTAGANDTVSLWVNPPVATNAPGVAAGVTDSTFDVGVITAFGFNINGGYSPVIDEIRVGDAYGDVVGASVAAPTPTIPTTLALSAVEGTQVSWSASSANSYQPQRSLNNSTWTNWGGLLIGSATTSLYDASPVPFYRVLELTPGGPGPDQMTNGNFEIAALNNSGAANWSSPANTTFENVWATNQYGALTPTSGAKFLFMEGSTAAASPVAPNTFALSDPIPVSPAGTYRVKWDAANPVKVGGANPQYRVRFLDGANAFISETWGSFASAGNAWQTFSNNFTAPANAAKLDVYFIQAIGAGASWDWVTLIDNVSVSGSTAGATNVLSTSVQRGVALTAIVQTNGVTASAATGNIKFQTNSVGLSTNGVSAGSTTSGTALSLPSPTTITAIYSGDSTYIASTNSLVWASNNAPTASSFAIGAQLGSPATILLIGGKFAPTDADPNDVANLVLVSVAGAANGTLSFSSTSFTYTATNGSSADTFNYTVSDGRNGYATGTVTVNISSPAGYNLLSVNGNVLSYLGIPGANYVLENTPTLTPPIVWTAITTNQVSPNGYLLFTNESPAGFYRTRYVSGP